MASLLAVSMHQSPHQTLNHVESWTNPPAGRPDHFYAILNIIFGLLNIVRAVEIRLKFIYRYFRRGLRVRFKQLKNKR